MPFDPRLINPDDAPEDAHGEIDLPDDLQELAAQLHDDALFLTARYPAKATLAPLVAEVAAQRKSSASPARMHRWFIGGGVAAALTIAVALAYRPTAEPRAVALPPEAPTTYTVASHEPSELPVSAPVGKAAGPRIERLPWAPTPAISEVTGPELEGLLDLWQTDEHPAETRISI